MGMFDSVFVPCPKCGKRSEIQTKAGACTLARYSSENVPAELVEGLKGETFTCCDVGWILEAPYVPRVSMQIKPLSGASDDDEPYD